MQPNFLGKISTLAAGSPVQLITDRTVGACKILFVTIPGFAGNIYVGGASMNTATLEGVLIQFNRPGMAGQPDHFVISSLVGHNINFFIIHSPIVEPAHRFVTPPAIRFDEQSNPFRSHEDILPDIRGKFKCGFNKERG